MFSKNTLISAGAPSVAFCLYQAVFGIGSTITGILPLAPSPDFFNLKTAFINLKQRVYLLFLLLNLAGNVFKQK